MTAPSHEVSLETNSQKQQRPRNAGAQRLEGLLVDDRITSTRIPREQIKIHRLISSGSYTEVYLGSYQDNNVAIKMLLPETRRCVDHIEALLAEVKIMATMEHPHIVSLVGVAWDVLADVCMVSEFMEGGNLRAFLASYEPQGFDRLELNIAVHVADALAYLHSFAPPVLHQNLKSTNILLTAELEAKISSFGALNERDSSTMTGKSRPPLWTAPEVLMGDRVDAKADIYSFGIMLSELDRHVLPFSDINDQSGKKLPDIAILHMIIFGKLRVEFSSSAASSIAALGTSCVSLAPDERPTAPEVAYSLRIILQHYTK